MAFSCYQTGSNFVQSPEPRKITKKTGIDRFFLLSRGKLRKMRRAASRGPVERGRGL